MTPMLFTHLIALSLLMGVLLAAALGDLKTYRIPNAFSLALLALYPIFAFTAPYPTQPLFSLAIMAGVLAVGFAMYSFHWIGGGDIKLMTAVSLFAGPALALEFLIITSLAGGAIAMLMINKHARANLAVALDTMGSRTLRDAVLTDVIPYGLAIAAGGVYLTLRLVGMASAAA